MKDFQLLIKQARQMAFAFRGIKALHNVKQIMFDTPIIIEADDRQIVENLVKVFRLNDAIL